MKKINDIASLAKTKFFKDTALSTIDQAWLSGINFALGLAFINFASKTDYGVYAQLFALMMLIRSILEALVNEPIITLGPKENEEKRSKMISGLFRFQLIASGVVSIVAMVGLLVASSTKLMSTLEASVAVPFAVAMFGFGLREYLRTIFFLKLDPVGTMATDFVYGITLIFGLFLLYESGIFDVTSVYECIAVANAASILFALGRINIDYRISFAQMKTDVIKAWECGRWSVPRTLVTWLFSNAYVYVTSIVLGTAMVADLSAARLFVMPLGLCFAAWGKIFLPRASKWLSEQNLHKTERAALYSVALLFSIVVLYLSVLELFYDQIETYLLGEKYKDIFWLVILWGGWALANVIRMVGTNTMLAASRYKEVFYFAVTVAALTLPITITATLLLGSVGPLYGHITSELILLGLTWFIGWRKARKSYKTLQVT